VAGRRFLGGRDGCGGVTYAKLMADGSLGDGMRVVVEIGPRGKKVVAVAPDWPGLQRGGANEESAIERLLAYLPRYAPVTKLAGMEAEFSDATAVDVIERYPGVGSTDFWGIAFAFSGIDRAAMTGEALERELVLMRACWAFFDEVRARVSAEMRKGPRGGGRDRDRIVQHTLFVELDWAKGLGVRTPPEELLTEEGLRAYRETYCDAIRTFHAEGKMAKTWPLRFLIRHTAFHTLDHTWEMQDKDLTASRA
jgi:hypothetical protein